MKIGIIDADLEQNRIFNYPNLYKLLTAECLEYFNCWYWRYQCECDYTDMMHERKHALIELDCLTTSMQRGVIFDFFDFSGMTLNYRYINKLNKYNIVLANKKTGLHLINYLDYKNIRTIDEAAIKLIELANNIFNYATIIIL